MLRSLLASPRRLAQSALGLEPPLPLEEAAYRRLKQKGYRPGGIVDVGAYHGDWTRLAHRVFGTVPTLMVEAQPQRSAFLDQACAELRDVRYVPALLAGRAGETVTFYEMETGSSLMAERSNAARRSDTFVTDTLDRVAAEMAGPLFLKIDVQGAELEVLAGGEETLARADLVQLEVAVLSYNEGAPAMLDVLSFMNARGFHPYDISGITRPTGDDLAQIDMLFTRPDSPLRPTTFLF